MWPRELQHIIINKPIEVTLIQKIIFKTPSWQEILQQMLKDVFYLFYGGVTMLNIVACFYLLFRRGNAIAPDITSSVRLRRWTAAFFAVSALSHLWNLPVFFLTSGDNVKLCYLVGALLDCMTIGPLALILLITMLQDRRRPLWPVAVGVAPFVVVMAMCVATRSDALLQVLYALFVVLAVAITVYMVRALRQYGRWLRDNYADLEHKEVWQSFVVLAVILSVLGIYTFDIEGLAYEYFIQVINVVLIFYLLWRVETLSDLSIPANDAQEAVDTRSLSAEEHDHSLSMRNNIGPLLKQHCEESRLYLQYDISLTELAKQIGTNRVYLSQHFAMQGTTYNTYINNLRIKHFISLCNEAAATHQPTTIQQLAYQSGFRSYGTFNTAFKQSMGMTATKWMRIQYR